MTRIIDKLKARRGIWVTTAILLPVAAVTLLTVISGHTLLIARAVKWLFVFSVVAGAILFYCTLRSEKWWNRTLSLLGYGVVQLIIYVIVSVVIALSADVDPSRCSKPIPGDPNTIIQCF